MFVLYVGGSCSGGIWDLDSVWVHLLSFELERCTSTNSYVDLLSGEKGVARQDKKS